MVAADELSDAGSPHAPARGPRQGAALLDRQVEPGGTVAGLVVRVLAGAGPADVAVRVIGAVAIAMGGVRVRHGGVAVEGQGETAMDLGPRRLAIPQGVKA